MIWTNQLQGAGAIGIVTMMWISVDSLDPLEALRAE